MKDLGGEMLIAIVVITLIIFVLVVVFLLLLVANNNRRNKHRAELAELQTLKERELIQAEREATKNTFSEIGRELHDNVGQLLTAAQIGLQNRFDEELDNDPQLNAVLGALEEGISAVSRLGRSLNENMWEDRSLFDALQKEAARIEQLGFGEVNVHRLDEGNDLSSAESTILFRSFQEVINNTLKHGQADEISISVQSNPSVITISDNGKGFDLNAVERGSGLHNIQHRCKLIQYDAQLLSAPGEGCTWIFSKKGIL